MSNHPIVHIEIPVMDTGAAGKFYGDLFGWKIESDAMYNYLQFMAEGGPGGGFVEVGQSNAPVLYSTKGGCSLTTVPNKRSAQQYASPS